MVAVKERWQTPQYWAYNAAPSDWLVVTGGFDLGADKIKKTATITIAATIRPGTSNRVFDIISPA